MSMSQRGHGVVGDGGSVDHGGGVVAWGLVDNRVETAKEKKQLEKKSLLILMRVMSM